MAESNDPRLPALLAQLQELLVVTPAAPSPPPVLPAWVSVEEYAAHVRKAPKTVRRWAAAAPPELARKYGRDWRLAGPAFDVWVRRGGPFRQHEEELKEQVH